MDLSFYVDINGVYKKMNGYSQTFFCNRSGRARLVEDHKRQRAPQAQGWSFNVKTLLVCVSCHICKRFLLPWVENVEWLVWPPPHQHFARLSLLATPKTPQITLWPYQLWKHFSTDACYLYGVLVSNVLQVIYESPFL